MWLYPPRPVNAVTPSLIKSFETRGYVGQIKMNGTLQVIDIDDVGNVTYRTRHNTPNKAWTPLPEMAPYFANYRDSVFVGELLHSKHASVKNTIYLFDVLRYMGKSLVGTTLADRLQILEKTPALTNNIQIIKTYDRDLAGLYHSLSEPTQEGIVLKDPKAKLRDCLRNGLNGGWQVKVRRPTENYGF